MPLVGELTPLEADRLDTQPFEPITPTTVRSRRSEGCRPSRKGEPDPLELRYKSFPHRAAKMPWEGDFSLGLSFGRDLVRLMLSRTSSYALEARCRIVSYSNCFKLISSIPASIETVKLSVLPISSPMYSSSRASSQKSARSFAEVVETPRHCHPTVFRKILRSQRDDRQADEDQPSTEETSRLEAGRETVNFAMQHDYVVGDPNRINGTGCLCVYSFSRS